MKQLSERFFSECLPLSVLCDCFDSQLYLGYEFPNPSTRCDTVLDSFRGYWRNRSFVIIIIIAVTYAVIATLL